MDLISSSLLSQLNSLTLKLSRTTVSRDRTFVDYVLIGSSFSRIWKIWNWTTSCDLFNHFRFKELDNWSKWTTSLRLNRPRHIPDTRFRESRSWGCRQNVAEFHIRFPISITKNLDILEMVRLKGDGWRTLVSDASLIAIISARWSSNAATLDLINECRLCLHLLIDGIHNESDDAMTIGFDWIKLVEHNRRFLAVFGAIVAFVVAVVAVVAVAAVGTGLNLPSYDDATGACM